MADADVQASLGHVGRDRGDDPNATPLLPTGATVVGVRFRVLRPHARGNLGQVSVAVDEELHREVALKEIQDRYADDAASRSRFLLEAEVTGGLEHPGIVPVYSLGQYDDGRPFYAMRFIKWDNLQYAIERFHRANGGVVWRAGGCRPTVGYAVNPDTKVLPHANPADPTSDPPVASCGSTPR